MYASMPRPEQGWADKITKVAIERDGDATHPWHLWGRDYETGLATEEVWDFATFSEAVAAIPAFFAAANEFDHAQHNEPNPILTWFRAVIEDPKCGEFNQVVDDFLIYHIKGHGKQEHHARAVLQRLAALAAIEERLDGGER